MKKSKLDHFHSFVNKQQERAMIPISGQVQICLDYCQYVIRTELDHHSKQKYKFKKRKGSVPDDFMRSFNEFTIQDKIAYYNKNVTYLVRLSHKNLKPPGVQDQIKQCQTYIRSLKLKRWKTYKLKLDSSRKILFSERKNNIKQLDLGDYIFRGSKNTQFFTFVLESINDVVGKKFKTIHIGFKDLQSMIEWGNAIQLCIDFKHWERIYIQLYKKKPNLTQINNQIQSKSEKFKKDKQMGKEQPVNPNKEVQIKQKLPSPIPQIEKKEQQDVVCISEDSDDDREQLMNRTIVDDLLDSDADNQSIGHIQDKNEQKSNLKRQPLNIFNRIFPEFDLNSLQDETNMKMLQYQNGIYRIMQDLNNPIHHKIFIDLGNIDTKIENVFNALSGPELQAGYNNNVQEISIKTFISSQNSAILYMKNKPFNKFYRSRDFIFIRHAFSLKDNFYVADHQLQNINFPPFMTIVRGSYSCIWGIYPTKDGYTVIGDLQMKNQGYLNEAQNTSLILEFLKGYSGLRNYLKTQQKALQNYYMFNTKWDISPKNQINHASAMKTKRSTLVKSQLKSSQHSSQSRKQHRIQVNDNKNVKITKNDVIKNTKAQNIKAEQQISIRRPSKLQKRTQAQLHNDQKKQQKQQVILEVKASKKQCNFETKSQIDLRFDSQGLVIVQKYFVTNNYQLKPINTKQILDLPQNGIHPLWKGEWAPQSKDGGLIYVDQKKMQDQKGVLKFVLTKIGKNLLSGKSVLNISLPVDIFCPKSNLQMLVQSLRFGPKILEECVKKPALQKIKSVTLFGLTMSPLYLNMQKPFNPILGQTFQSWINGCPAYAQQISHHPPISALLFYGRGYRIDAQLESKVQLHMNSGCGSNDGVFRIKYDSGEQVCYTSPSGQISGLTYGDRKFNFVGKSYVWMLKEKLFIEIAFNPHKKGFFSSGKQQKSIDFFQGTICEVKPEFFIKFDLKKKKPPAQSDIVRKFGKIHGIWHQSIYFEDQILLNYNKQFPYKMQYQKFALPSDSNWRQDIAYRRLMQVSRAQAEKQRLQIIQRKDRKLRAQIKK